MNGANRQTLLVSAVRAEARDVISVEMRHPTGERLPAFTAGAHLELMLASDQSGGPSLIRHYSLCNSPAETHRYVIAVVRADEGRGGSRNMHELVRVGTKVEASLPVNHFPLVPAAGHYCFIAGGIGITPLLSMLRWCETHRKEWSLLYCTRSRLRTAFYEELREFGDRVRFHFSDEAGGERGDLAHFLADPVSDEHVYCCGPASMMRAVQEHSTHRADGTVHFEWFSVGDQPAEAMAPRTEFVVVLKSTGQRMQVTAKKSILETLEDNDVAVPFSCREGLCRTCETRICAGRADHRDLVLSQKERDAQSTLLVCVSRAETPELVLDL